MMTYQVPKSNPIDRKDHVWQLRRMPDGSYDYKCCLCGAITANPPNHPTPTAWLPSRFEPLTERERALVPNPNAVHLAVE